MKNKSSTPAVALEPTEQPATQGQALGALVREARTAKGWTLRETAPKIDVTWQWLQRMEGGAFHQPDASRMARLVGLLGIDPVRLAEVSGGYIPDELPDPIGYLRTKYGATDDQIADFERWRKEIKLGVLASDEAPPVTDLDSKDRATGEELS
ncbi:MAG: helix-turn-helix transcriptional regulator [Patulibacter minatonensis]